MLLRIALVVAALVVIAAAIVAAAIAFDEPAAPPVLAAGDSVPGIDRWNLGELPATQTLKARDGAPLLHRVYPGRPDRAVVLVHGSSGSGTEMMKVAQALQAEGATVYSISLRGHGGSGTRNGDVSYVGQLEDDLADLVEGLGLDRQGVRRTLAGFSAGGGFVLRVAGGGRAGLFDDYLAISPYIAFDSPTSKPNSGGWADVALPRVVALSVLDRLGLPWFQGLPVIHFATNARAEENRTPVYSFRLMASIQLGRDWRAVMARITAPTTIVVGSDDELFDSGQFQPMLQAVNPRISLAVVPGQTHLGMLADAAATAAIAAAWRK